MGRRRNTPVTAVLPNLLSRAQAFWRNIFHMALRSSSTPSDAFDVIVVGAGIVGLAHALAAARRGKSVAVFERSPRASGASIRNFGTIWPIGQPAGAMHRLALRSRHLWAELLEDAGMAHRSTGSLHVVYRDDEAEVAREFADLAPALGYDCEWLDASTVLSRSSAVSPEGLIGGLWSAAEITVDPREVAVRLPEYLVERFGVVVRYGTAVTAIDAPLVRAGGSVVRGETVIVCSGDDFETLYPDLLQSAGMTRCKLQMLRTPPQPGAWQLGPALASGLTLQHYASFKVCSSLDALKRRIADETPELNRWGIHILVSQTGAGEITLGDSHEYGTCVDIFDKQDVDELIVAWARRFLRLPDWSIAQRWHGVYARHPGRSFLSLSPEEGVRVVTALGGAGMTLSLGLGEQTMRELD
jgi:FAD dependent oxidoreductase TIGR03364